MGILLYDHSYSVHAWYVLYEPVFMWNVPGMLYHMIMARCGVDH